MIDHISIPVSNLERSLAFYSAAYAPLGYQVMMKLEEFKALEQQRAQTEADKALAAAAIKAVEKTKRAPVPQANPIAPAAQPTTASVASNVPENRPFWKLWN